MAEMVPREIKLNQTELTFPLNQHLDGRAQPEPRVSKTVDRQSKATTRPVQLSPFASSLILGVIRGK